MQYRIDCDGEMSTSTQTRVSTSLGVGYGRIGSSNGSRSVGLRTQPRKLSRGAGEKDECGLLWAAFAPAKCWRPASVLQH